MLQDNLTNEGPYKTRIDGIRLQLLELPAKNTQVKDNKTEKSRMNKDSKDKNKILHY